VLTPPSETVNMHSSERYELLMKMNEALSSQGVSMDGQYMYDK
jgi:hypothetical protein